MIMINILPLIKFKKIELCYSSLGHYDHYYKFPEFFHSKVCLWYDIYGIKFLSKTIYLIIIH